MGPGKQVYITAVSFVAPLRGETRDILGVLRDYHPYRVRGSGVI